MKTACDSCEKVTGSGARCLCHFCSLNDRCKKTVEHCRERESCPIGCYTDPFNSWVPMEEGGAR